MTDRCAWLGGVRIPTARVYVLRYALVVGHLGNDNGVEKSSVTEAKNESGVSMDRLAITEPAETRAGEGEETVRPLVADTYRVSEVIGQGGMGVVLLAHDERLKRDVAIKFIAQGLLDKPGARERFIHEARAMARVRHENVVQIFALGEHEGVPYFAMEYVPGINLAGWMSTLGGKLPSADVVLGVIEQVGRGLDAIHRAGNVHADVKPGNVLIGPSHRIALADFGLARALGAVDGTGLIVGTPSYLPPEVISAETILDGRADVFSLGVMTYEMFTGELPFPVESIDDFFRVHRTDFEPVPVTAFRDDLSQAFDHIIRKAIDRDPDKRFATAGEFAYALLDAREELRTTLPGFRIVVADDDDTFRRVATATLEFAFPGCQVVAVADGASALAETDRMRTDLAVIDLDMPGLNGVELTAAIRAQGEHSNMPILVVTASGGATDWRLLQSIGADGFLVKPLQPLSLVATARRILRK